MSKPGNAVLDCRPYARSEAGSLGSASGSRLFASALLRDVLEGMRAEPGRVGLSFFAMTIGIVALTVLLAVLGGLKDRSKSLVQELGGNVMAVSTDVEDGGRNIELERRHVRLLAANFPDCRVSAQRLIEMPLAGSKKTVAVIATDETLARVRGWTIRQGRFLDQGDVARGERNAVITSMMAEAQGWRLGAIVSLDGVPFRVVGVTDAGAAAVQREQAESRFAAGEQAVFVPYTAPPARKEIGREAARRVDTIFMQVPPAEDVEDYVPRARQVFDGPGGWSEGLVWITPESLLRGVRRLQNAVSLAGGSIAFLCLVLGGTTLMSLMVANVRDRVTEIGLRRALGATAGDIAVLFVAEACLLTCFAALAGTIGAGALLLTARNRFAAPLAVGFWGVAAPFAVAMFLGVLFSFWPARLAARISPAEALRND